MPTLRLEALEPTGQCIRKVFPRNFSSDKVRPEIIAMLSTRQHIPKDLALPLTLSTFRRIGKPIRVRRTIGFTTQRGQRPPRIEFTAGPVNLRGTDIPASEDLVGKCSARPFGEEGGFGGRELPVADVFLVGKGVVFAE